MRSKRYKNILNDNADVSSKSIKHQNRVEILLNQLQKKQLEEIAKEKMADLNAHDTEQAAKIIAGSARSMGIEVKE